jgi:hypothetical protein
VRHDLKTELDAREKIGISILFQTKTAMEIKNRVIRTESVEWRSFKFVQTTKFKHFPPDLEARLRESMISNHFLETFKVWEHKGEIYCLDGYHRCLILRQLEERGYTIPEKLPCEFIECKSKAEAAKLVLIYSSAYATVNKSELHAFIGEYGLDVDRLSEEINLQFSAMLNRGGEEGEDENSEPEYPIVPKFSERYDYVLVFTKNDIDFTNLLQLLGLETQKSYKNQAVGISRVMTYDQFMSAWKSRS